MKKTQSKLRPLVIGSLMLGGAVSMYGSALAATEVIGIYPSDNIAIFENSYIMVNPLKTDAEEPSLQFSESNGIVALTDNRIRNNFVKANQIQAVKMTQSDNDIKGIFGWYDGNSYQTESATKKYSLPTSLSPLTFEERAKETNLQGSPTAKALITFKDSRIETTVTNMNGTRDLTPFGFYVQKNNSAVTYETIPHAKDVAEKAAKASVEGGEDTQNSHDLGIYTYKAFANETAAFGGYAHASGESGNININMDNLGFTGVWTPQAVDKESIVIGAEGHAVPVDIAEKDADALNRIYNDEPMYFGFYGKASDKGSLTLNNHTGIYNGTTDGLVMDSMTGGKAVATLTDANITGHRAVSVRTDNSEGATSSITLNGNKTLTGVNGWAIYASGSGASVTVGGDEGSIFHEDSIGTTENSRVDNRISGRIEAMDKANVNITFKQDTRTREVIQSIPPSVTSNKAYETYGKSEVEEKDPGIFVNSLKFDHAANETALEDLLNKEGQGTLVDYFNTKTKDASKTIAEYAVPSIRLSSLVFSPAIMHRWNKLFADPDENNGGYEHEREYEEYEENISSLEAIQSLAFTAEEMKVLKEARDPNYEDLPDEDPESEYSYESFIGGLDAESNENSTSFLHPSVLLPEKIPQVIKTIMASSLREEEDVKKFYESKLQEGLSPEEEKEVRSEVMNRLKEIGQTRTEILKLYGLIIDASDTSRQLPARAYLKLFDTVNTTEMNATRKTSEHFNELTNEDREANKAQIVRREGTFYTGYLNSSMIAKSGGTITATIKDLRPKEGVDSEYALPDFALDRETDDEGNSVLPKLKDGAMSYRNNVVAMDEDSTINLNLENSVYDGAMHEDDQVLDPEWYGRVVVAREKGTVNLNATNKSEVSANLLSQTDGTINATFNDSTFKATTKSSYVQPGQAEDTKEGAINLTLENNSLWNLVPDKNEDATYNRFDPVLTNLIVNDSTVALYNNEGKDGVPQGEYAPTAERTITMENLSGNNGKFVMALDSSRPQQADRLLINDTFTGHHTLEVHDIQGYEESLNNPDNVYDTVLASVKNNEGTFVGSTVEGVLTHKKFILAVKDHETAEGEESPYTKDWYIKKVEDLPTWEHPTTTVQANASAMHRSYLTWRGAITPLHERLGEWNEKDNKENNIWFRTKQGTLSQSGIFGFDGKMKTYELGFDAKVTRLDHKERYQGFSVFGIKGNGDMPNGTYKSRGLGLSLYQTDMYQSGRYVDVVARIGQMKDEHTATNSEGLAVSGESKNRMLSVSLETGKRHTFSNKWYIEPQVQLIASRINGDTYLTSNDVTVTQDSMNSLVSRLGIQFGKTLDKGLIYGTVNYKREWLGSTNTTFTLGDKSTNLDPMYRGGWWTVGLGAQYMVSDSARLYAHLERATDGSLKTWNAGVRIRF